MMNFFKKNIFIVLIFILVFVGAVIHSFPSKKNEFPLSYILPHQVTINKYCKALDLDARLYVSVIYGELINNFNAFDNFDEIRAYLGFNPSVGFAQLRISTIKWIELNYSHHPLVSQSSSRKELINKGINDTTNIIYSVLYVKLISKKLANYNSVISIGSYYGRGIDNEGIIDSNYTNVIGESAESFYFSNKLKSVF